MRARPYLAAWFELLARAAALVVLVCSAHACTGPGLEPPSSDNAGAGTDGHSDAGQSPTGGNSGAGAGAGGSGAGGFGPPSGGSGGAAGEDDVDAGEASMDASVDDEDGGAD